jgi:hypothetical protein
MAGNFSFRYAVGVMPTAHLPETTLSVNKRLIEDAVRDSGYDGEIAVIFYNGENVRGSMWPSGSYTGWGIGTERMLTLEEKESLKKLQLKPMHV